MKLFKYFGLMFVLFILICTSQAKMNGMTQEETNLVYNPIQNITFELMDSISYTNPYNKDFSFEDAILNLVNVILYDLSVTLNTIIGASVNLSWDYLNYDSLVLAMKLLIFMGIIWAISKLFVPVIATYILIDDLCKEKGYNLEWYSIAGLTFILWLGILLFILVGYLII